MLVVLLTGHLFWVPHSVPYECFPSLAIAKASTTAFADSATIWTMVSVIFV